MGHVAVCRSSCALVVVRTGEEEHARRATGDTGGFQWTCATSIGDAVQRSTKPRDLFRTHCSPERGNHDTGFEQVLYEKYEALFAMLTATFTPRQPRICASFTLVVEE